MTSIKSQLDNININIDVVVYVTGYVVHHVLKVKKCSNCKILLENEDEESPSTYFADINRGGLISPSKIASEFMIILTKVYVAMQKTLEKSQQPRNVLISSYLQIIEDHPKLDISCASGHQLIDLLRLAARSFANCLLKNTVARLSSVKHPSTTRKITKLNNYWV